MCLAVGLAAAAVASAAVAWFLTLIGLPIVLLVILFLVVWGVLLMVVDGWCAGRHPKDTSTHHSVEAAVVHEEASAKEDDAAAKAAAEKAEAEAKAAAEKAEAEAKAAAEKAAAEEQAAVAEKAAAEAKAAEEAAEAARKAALAAKASEAESKPDAADAGSDDGARPEALDGPRGGVADDLKRIKGIGPKLEQVCNALGFYHFEQIANWTADEIAWVDSNLEGFRGRVTRDDWVAQAKSLAGGGDT